MQPLFLVFCLLLSINSLFAQSSAELSERKDTTKVVLCTNSKGEPGFLIDKGNGQTEFQTVDQFVRNKASLQSKNSLPRTVSEKATTGAASSAKNKGSEAVVAGQSAGRDSSALLRPYKLPPVLSEGPPSHH